MLIGHVDNVLYRHRFEKRWLTALSRIDIPMMFFWGDSDAVAPMEIPKAIATKYVKGDKFLGKTMKGNQHKNLSIFFEFPLKTIFRCWSLFDARKPDCLGSNNQELHSE